MDIPPEEPRGPSHQRDGFRIAVACYEKSLAEHISPQAHVGRYEARLDDRPAETSVGSAQILGITFLAEGAPSAFCQVQGAVALASIPKEDHPTNEKGLPNTPGACSKISCDEAAMEESRLGRRYEAQTSGRHAVRGFEGKKEASKPEDLEAKGLPSPDVKAAPNAEPPAQGSLPQEGLQEASEITHPFPAGGHY